MHEPDRDGMRGADASLAALLRAASAGDSPDGAAAAARVADGAWALAAARRTRSAAETARPAKRLLRSGAWTAAAAAGLLAVLLAPAGEARALSVEGEPVRVLERGAWRPASAVSLDAWIYAPPGVRALIDRSGGILRPDAGSLFRLRSEGVDAARRLEVIRGRVEFAGGLVEAAAADLRIAGGGGLPTCVFALASGGPAGAGGLPGTDPAIWVAGGDGAPSVAVRAGRVRIRLAGSAEDLSLGASEEAAVVSLGGGRHRRLARLRAFDETVVPAIVRGAAVIDAEPLPRSGVGFVLQRRAEGLWRVDVPSGRLHEAVAGMNEAMRTLVLRLGEPRGAPLGVFVAAEIHVRSTDPPGDGALRVYEATRGDRVTRVVTHGDGPATLETPDAPAECYPCLAALRAARPEAVAVFGDALP